MARRCLWIVLMALSFSVLAFPRHAEAAAIQPVTLEHQLLADVNQDRVQAHQPLLREDKTLDSVARARAWWILVHHSVTHCNTDTLAQGCRLQVQDQFAWRGMDLSDTWTAENLGVAPYPDIDAQGMNGLLMASPEHAANVVNGTYTKVGTGVLCCFEGHVGSTQIGPNQPETVYVEVFSS